MALFHCPRCRREFDAPEGTVAHFHRCLDKGARKPQRIEALPEDEPAREDLWHGLLSMVRQVRPFVDPDNA